MRLLKSNSYASYAHGSMRLEVKQRSSSPGPLTRMKKSHCLGCKPIYMNSVMQIEVLEGICQRAKASGSARVVCNMATVTSLPFHQHFYETWWYTSTDFAAPALVSTSTPPLQQNKIILVQGQEVHFTVTFL